MLHNLRNRLKRKDFSARGNKQLFHVFPALLESPARYACYYVVTRPLRSCAVAHAQGVKMLDARHLVAGRAVVFRQFCLDHNLGIEFIGDDEVGRLLESLDPLGTICFPGADAVLGQHFFNRNLYGLPDNIADGVSMPRKRPSEEAFIEEHGIRDTDVREWGDAL